MDLKTLVVHFRANASNDHLLLLTADLASQFHSKVVGVMAFESIPIAIGEGYIAAGVMDMEQERLQRIASDTEERFRELLEGSAIDLDWRASFCFGPPEARVAESATLADLVITSSGHVHNVLPEDGFHVGALVMRTGRPVLVVPPEIKKLKLDNVMIAWKDSRETRRAIHDALPFLQKAGTVRIVQVTRSDQLEYVWETLHDVVDWLKEHGVKATPQAIKTSGDDIADLEAAASSMHADLVVAGAYGHTRLQEWFLGGVTRDLLMRTRRCALVSH